MRLFFDMDNTLIGDRGQLRPLVREVFERLTAEGHDIYIWSGIGLRWREVREHALDPYVLDCYYKPIEGWEALQAEQAALREFEPDLVIDDIPAFVEEYGGIVVRPYFWERADDREMERVHRIVQDVAATGSSSDRAFRPGWRRVWPDEEQWPSPSRSPRGRGKRLRQ